MAVSKSILGLKSSSSNEVTPSLCKAVLSVSCTWSRKCFLSMCMAAANHDVSQAVKIGHGLHSSSRDDIEMR